MAVRLVYIIWSNPLSHDSLRLLLKQPEVELVGTTSDRKSAMDEIKRLKPDTVIVESTKSRMDSDTLAILKSCPWVSRIIDFSMDDNTMRVYQREEKTVAQVEDLLDLIKRE